MNKFWILPLMALFFLLGCSSSEGDDNPDSNDDDPVNVDKSQNLLATGASANDLLSNANFDRLLVEVAYVDGFRPTAESMSNFVQFLQNHTFKQDIEIEYLKLDSPDEESLTLQEIADLESEHRTAYNNGTTLAVYIYFADAPSDGDDMDEGLVTLGAVYRNTSMVIFERTIRTLAARSLSITNTDVETATLNHEFGHLFGLVDLGTAQINAHEDPDAANHCNVNGCLMRAELIFGAPTSKQRRDPDLLVPACSLSGHSVMKLLQHQKAKGSAIVPGLDAECILDLQNNGGQ